MKIKRILISGATGFIGSLLMPLLIKRGYDIAIISRQLSYGSRPGKLLNKIKIYETDLLNAHKIIPDFNPEAIIHLAAYYCVRHSPQDVSRLIDTNVSATANLLEAAGNAGVKVFINTSSCFVYKKSKAKLNETSPLSPFNFYALTKILAEQCCSFYAKKYGLNCVTLRLFPPYGPGDKVNKFIPYLIRSFAEGKVPRLTSGKQKWDFVYAEDIARAYLRALDSAPFPGKHEIFNIGTGKAVNFKVIASTVKKIMRGALKLAWGEIPDREGEFYFLCADISKAKKLLKWKPKVNILDEGLKRTAISYRDYFAKKEGLK